MKADRGNSPSDEDQTNRFSSSASAEEIAGQRGDANRSRKESGGATAQVAHARARARWETARGCVPDARKEIRWRREKGEKREKRDRRGKDATALAALSQQLAVRLQLLAKVERAKEGRRGSARMQE